MRNICKADFKVLKEKVQYVLWQISVRTYTMWIDP